MHREKIVLMLTGKWVTARHSRSRAVGGSRSISREVNSADKFDGWLVDMGNADLGEG